MAESGVPWRWIGRVGGDRLVIRSGGASRDRPGARTGSPGLEERLCATCQLSGRRSTSTTSSTTSAGSSASGITRRPPTSPTSACTRCSTAARSPRASPPRTATPSTSRRPWAGSPTCSAASGSSGCPGTGPSATCGTRRRAARTCATPSRSRPRPSTARWRSPTTATWSTPRRSGRSSSRTAPSSSPRRTPRSSSTCSRAPRAATLVDQLAAALTRVKGAYTLLLLTPDSMIGVRDPSGFRPLTLGRLGDTWLLASETCALDLMEAKVVRDVEPGEILVVDRDGACTRSGRSGPPSGCSACSSTCTSRAPTRCSGAATCTACARRSAISSRASIRSRPTS